MADKLDELEHEIRRAMDQFDYTACMVIVGEWKPNLIPIKTESLSDKECYLLLLEANVRYLKSKSISDDMAEYLITELLKMKHLPAGNVNYIRKDINHV